MPSKAMIEPLRHNDESGLCHSFSYLNLAANSLLTTEGDWMANGGGNHNLTWRIVGASFSAVLFAIGSWFGSFVMNRLDRIDSKMEDRAIIMERITNTQQQQARDIERIENNVEMLTEGIAEIKTQDIESVREQIRAALASRHVGQ